MKKLFILLVLACALGKSAAAQQTIVNVPSTDILDKGKVYLEFDASYKFDKDVSNTVNRFSSFVPRVVVGIGNKIEVGMNIIGNIQPGADATTLVPTIKAKVLDKESWAIVTGANIYIPVRNRAYKLGSYTYLQASKTLKSNTRLTFGGYHTSKNVFASGAQRAGGQFAIEQSINSKFSIGADWITGKHAAGYLTPVLTYKPHPKVAIYQGYSIGNADVTRGNHFFYTAIGINLN
jgi:opacity protein-like surface antigen